MDPYQLLIPSNQLLAGPQPHTVPIARCDCGEYGCGSTDVTITADGDRVHGKWLLEVPMHRTATFAAAAYAEEVERAAADHSWETPDRTAGRRSARPARHRPQELATGTPRLTGVPQNSG
jgi:hypothetical protein